MIRDVAFIGLVLGGVVALGVNLIPPREKHQPTSFQHPSDTDAALAASVKKLDAAFAEQWDEHGVKPVGPADELTLARRMALGLAGTVPSLEEIRRFEALPPGERLSWYTEELLADRRSHNYLAERLARATVGVDNGPLILYRRYRYVTWLAEQLEANRPYNTMVKEIISSSGLWTDSPATNFISVTAEESNKNQPDPVRLAGRVTRAFLGLRIDCAQCHDHPFAPWKQADFEGLSAYFGQTQIS
ncbi:MAG: DUF1549 domain-containing protein, partial [Gemmataceae bacterium]